MEVCFSGDGWQLVTIIKKTTKTMTTKKTVEEVRIELLEANIERLDDVCNILKIQKAIETIPIIRLIQASLMLVMDDVKEERLLNKINQQ